MTWPTRNPVTALMSKPPREVGRAPTVSLGVFIRFRACIGGPWQRLGDTGRDTRGEGATRVLKGSRHFQRQQTHGSARSKSLRFVRSVFCKTVFFAKRSPTFILNVCLTPYGYSNRSRRSARSCQQICLQLNIYKKCTHTYMQRYIFTNMHTYA